MRQTLFHIPAHLFGIPTLGMGWALLVWTLVSCFFAWSTYRELKQLDGQDANESSATDAGGNAATRALLSLTVYLVLGVVILGFALPGLEEHLDKQNLGLPVRGYGVAMFIAVCSGVMLAIVRGRRRGLDTDRILALAIWLFVAGIGGARLFFLIQNRGEFADLSLRDAIRTALNVAGGGLVVYGSLIGALLAYTLFVRKYRLPPLFVADLLAPSMLIGLAIGRVGCLMNGCCYGAPCDYPWAIQFPAGSLPYVQQLHRGLQHGVYFTAESVHPESTRDENKAGLATEKTVTEKKTAETTAAKRADPDSHYTVKYVDGDGPAAEAGVLPGLRLDFDDARELSAASFPQAVTVVDRSAAPGSESKSFTWKAMMAPARSFPTHPAQLYSAINAFLLCGLILAISPFTRRDGALLAITLLVYPITRFLLEIVRIDEPAVNQFGWTISQTVSVLIFAVGLALAVFVWRQPIGKMWARQITAAEPS